MRFSQSKRNSIIEKIISGCVTETTTKTNEIIQIDQCPCATEEVNKYLKEIPFKDRPKGRIHIFGSKNIASIPDGFDKIVVAEQS